MAFDATDFVVTETPAPVRDPKSITDPRERVAYLRDYLRALPPERFDLHYMYGSQGRDVWSTDRTAEQNHACGTTACVAGWAHYLFEPQSKDTGAMQAAALLGLTPRCWGELFSPMGYRDRPSPTSLQAANVLDHYLATGKIDWSVA